MRVVYKLNDFYYKNCNLSSGSKYVDMVLYYVDFDKFLSMKKNQNFKLLIDTKKKTKYHNSEQYLDY